MRNRKVAGRFKYHVTVGDIVGKSFRVFCLQYFYLLYSCIFFCTVSCLVVTSLFCVLPVFFSCNTFSSSRSFTINSARCFSSKSSVGIQILDQIRVIS